jgi:hypothetical protein
LAPSKEVNSFFGDSDANPGDDVSWRTGQWHRDVDRFAANCDGCAAVVWELVARALSHHAQHAREGAESRQQVLVVAQERLLANHRSEEPARVFAHVGADLAWWDERLEDRPETRRAPAAELRGLLGGGLPEWPR